MENPTSRLLFISITYRTILELVNKLSIPSARSPTGASIQTSKQVVEFMPLGKDVDVTIVLLRVSNELLPPHPRKSEFEVVTMVEVIKVGTHELIEHCLIEAMKVVKPV